MPSPRRTLAKHNLDPHRCRTALYLARKTLPEVAALAGVSLRHIMYVIDGERRGSERIYVALREAMGPHGWAFATKRVNVLQAPDGE